MQIYKLFGVVSISLLTSSVYTNVYALDANLMPKTHWLAGINLGGAITQPGKSQTIITQDSPQKSNDYLNNTKLQNNFLVGAFVGLDFSVSPKLNYQLSLTYNQIQPYSVEGQIQQLNTPSSLGFNYEYQLQSQQIFVESKLLFNMPHHLHPYFAFGLGESFSNSYNFRTTELDPRAVKPGTFNDHRNTNFAYTLGVGLDVNVTKYVYIGGGYQFANLGKTNLGVAPSFVTNEGLSTNLMTHELLATVTYIF